MGHRGYNTTTPLEESSWWVDVLLSVLWFNLYIWYIGNNQKQVKKYCIQCITSTSNNNNSINTDQIIRYPMLWIQPYSIQIIIVVNHHHHHHQSLPYYQSSVLPSPLPLPSPSIDLCLRYEYYYYYYGTPRSTSIFIRRRRRRKTTAEIITTTTASTGEVIFDHSFNCLFEREREREKERAFGNELPTSITDTNTYHLKKK